MEEEDQGLRFICKLCSKKYPCGKSLGGHMRSHVISISDESDQRLEPNVKKISSLDCKDSSRFEFGGQSGYGLRENPKKTWRVSNPSFPSQQEQICKQCGKGFQSLKALCGHMACHSEKDRILKDDQSWTSENQKLVMESHSDTEVEAPRPRPKRMRYKRVVVKSYPSFANGSSSVSDIDHEQEEVAMCLMMLSRDFGNWVGVDSVVDSSDDDSVVLETKSSSIDMMRIGRKKGLDCAVYNCDDEDVVGIKKLGKGKLKSGGVLDADESVQFENSDSEYFMNGPKKTDSDISVDGFLTNGSFKKQKLEVGSRFEVSDIEFGKGLSKGKLRGTESRKKEENENGIPSNLIKCDPRKRNTLKRSKYECGTKKQQIAQALSCNGERRLKKKKNKGHECPICHRVFKSGQALGGHKRSHFLGGSEHRISQTSVNLIKQDLSAIPDLLDLNLPAPEEEEEAPW